MYLSMIMLVLRICSSMWCLLALDSHVTLIFHVPFDLRNRDPLELGIHLSLLLSFIDVVPCINSAVD